MSDALPRARPIAELLYCLAGPAVWAAHFFVLYGAHALICARMGASAPGGLWPFLAASATALALLGLAGIIALRVRFGARRNGRSEARFSREVAIGLALLSMLGVVWGALPAALMAPCGG
jgi:hypothetical protein